MGPHAVVVLLNGQGGERIRTAGPCFSKVVTSQKPLMIRYQLHAKFPDESSMAINQHTGSWAVLGSNKACITHQYSRFVFPAALREKHSSHSFRLRGKTTPLYWQNYRPFYG